jgi:hypothetical protein
VRVREWEYKGGDKHNKLKKNVPDAGCHDISKDKLGTYLYLP